MKCNYCGFESNEDFLFCPDCGKNAKEQELVYAEPVSLNPAADIVLGALRDKLFLVICILVSAATIFQMSNGSVNLIGILMSVFLWLTYASSQKGIADEKQLRNISGTYYALNVINYVAGGLLLFVGLLFGFIVVLLSYSGKPIINDVFSDFDFSSYGVFSEVVELLLSVSAWLIFPIIIISSIAVILFTYFLLRPCHRFLKSVYTSVETGIPLFNYANFTKIFFLINGIVSGVGALNVLLNGNLIGAVSAGSAAAAYILGSILIKKHIIDSTLVNQ